MRRLAILLAVCATAAFAQSSETATAELKNAQGQLVGRVALSETPHGVLMHVTLTGVPAGTHAFHVHTSGICEPPFTSAGGHFNPGAAQHGIENDKGMHAGDMPNVQVPSDGSLTFDVLNAGVTLKEGASNSLFKPGGTAIVLHGGADDYKSDPAGNAGPRIACGIVTH